MVGFFKTFSYLWFPSEDVSSNQVSCKLLRFTRCNFCADKLDSSEAICLEPGCLKYFSNEDCLKEHIQLSHRHVTCEICGTKQLKQNLKRHLCMHDADRASERIKCHFDGCSHTFSTVSSTLRTLVYLTRY